MTIQVFLTLWLVMQMIGSAIATTRLSRLKGHTENRVIASVVGVIFRFVGIFVCLYIGEFYN